MTPFDPNSLPIEFGLIPIQFNSIQKLFMNIQFNRCFNSKLFVRTVWVKKDKFVYHPKRRGCNDRRFQNPGIARKGGEGSDPCPVLLQWHFCNWAWFVSEKFVHKKSDNPTSAELKSFLASYCLQRCSVLFYPPPESCRKCIQCLTFLIIRDWTEDRVRICEAGFAILFRCLVFWACQKVTRYDAISANVMICVLQMSESGQMVSEKVKWS